MTAKAITNSEAIYRHAALFSPVMRPSRVASSMAGPISRRVPLFVPADQVYYWSSEWQRGEAETRANLKAGNSKTFDSPLDAIRHLLSDC